MDDLNSVQNWHWGDDEADREAAGRRSALATLAREAGFVTQEQVDEAIAEGAASGERLGEVFLRRSHLTEDQLAELLARQRDLPYLPSWEVPDRSSAPDLLPIEAARALGGYVVDTDEGGRPLVAVADPTEERLGAIGAALAQEVSFAVVPKGTLERLLADGGEVDRRADAMGSFETTTLGGDNGTSQELIGRLEQADVLLQTTRDSLDTLTRLFSELREVTIESEREVADLRAERAHEREELERLRAEVDGRGAKLEQLRETLANLSTTI